MVKPIQMNTVKPHRKGIRNMNIFHKKCMANKLWIALFNEPTRKHGTMSVAFV